MKTVTVFDLNLQFDMGLNVSRSMVENMITLINQTLSEQYPDYQPQLMYESNIRYDFEDK